MDKDGSDLKDTYFLLLTVKFSYYLSRSIISFNFRPHTEHTHLPSEEFIHNIRVFVKIVLCTGT